MKNGYFHMNIANNISAVKSIYLVDGQNIPYLADDRITSFVKSIRNNTQL